jgi:hypothetical protein
MSAGKSEPAPASEETPQQKKFLDTVLTATPVLLTVLATMAAGLSSKEMTLGQYQRALAAQDQSKVGDQWNFFQAKRIRGTSLEMTLGLLQSMSDRGEVTPDELRQSIERTLAGLEQAQLQADQLLKAIQNASGDLGQSAGPLKKAAEKLQAASGKKAHAAAEKLWDDLAVLLGDKKEVRKGKDGATADETDAELSSRKVQIADWFSYLSSDRLPVVPDEIEKKGGRVVLKKPQDVIAEEAAQINEKIPQALQEVEDRKTEAQMAGLLKGIKPEQIHEAIDKADARARGFENTGKPANDFYRAIDRWLVRELALLRTLHAAARQVGEVKLPNYGKGLDEVLAALRVVEELDKEVMKPATVLANSFKAAQLDYNARRYDREARYNQAIAGLHELQVRKSGLASEAHRARSAMYFYGMLAAQAGVTIATFALARRQLVLLSLSGLVGLATLIIIPWVFLMM